jgi:hypothetical protein
MRLEVSRVLLALEVTACFLVKKTDYADVTIVYDKSIGLQEYLSFDHSTTGNQDDSLNKLEGAVSELVEGPDDLDLALVFHFLEYGALFTNLPESILHAIDCDTFNKFRVG